MQKEKLFKILHSCICSLGEALLDAEMINALLRILFASSTDCSYRILLTKSLSIEVPYHSRKSLLTSLPQAVERGYKDAVFPEWTKRLILHPTLSRSTGFTSAPNSAQKFYFPEQKLLWFRCLQDIYAWNTLKCVEFESFKCLCILRTRKGEGIC